MAGGMHWIQESFADTAACSQRRSSGLQFAIARDRIFFSLVAKSAAVFRNDHGQNQCWARPQYREEKTCSSTSAPLAHSPAC